jgi:hypothetical protein
VAKSSRALATSLSRFRRASLRSAFVPPCIGGG